MSIPDLQDPQPPAAEEQAAPSAAAVGEGQEGTPLDDGRAESSSSPARGRSDRAEVGAGEESSPALPGSPAASECSWHGTPTWRDMTIFSQVSATALFTCTLRSCA